MSERIKCAMVPAGGAPCPVVAERDRVAARVAELAQERDKFSAHLEGLNAVARSVRQQRDTLAAALEIAQWAKAESGEQSFCPSCRRWKAYGHSEDCPIGAALAALKEGKDVPA